MQVNNISISLKTQYKLDKITQIECPNYGKSQRNVRKRVPQSQIYSRIMKFINKLTEDQEFYSKVIDKMKVTNRIKSKNQKSKKNNFCCQFNECDSLVQAEYYRTQTKMDSFIKSFKSNSKRQNPGKHDKKKVQKVQRRASRKVSIMIEPQSSISEYASTNSIDISCKSITQSLIQQIYQSPSPFFINLSLCLFIRYLQYSNKPQSSQITWLLCISTLCSYKIYYDEEMSGVIEMFADILNIDNKKVAELERIFLKTIDYQLIVSNCHYHYMLTLLASDP